MRHTPFARHKNTLNSEMNVVPYIDVMLVLLIIFMATAPMITTGVLVDLPKERTQSITKDSQLPVIVTLDKEGNIFLSSQSAIDEPVTTDDLVSRLSLLAEQSTDDGGTSTLQVLVNADAGNEYRTLMGLMAKLQQAGIGKVGLLTQHPPKQ